MQNNSSNSFDDEGQSVATELVKCENCGSNLIFDAESGKLKCEHCGTYVEFAKNNASEQDIMRAFNDDEKWKYVDSSVFHCPNCGAKVVLSKGESAKQCPFCGTAHVEKVEELSGIKPNAVVPFSFGTDKAVEISKTWAKGKFFAPNKFKKNLSCENVKGIYIPSFTFDSSTCSTYYGRIGETHTRVVGSGKDRRVETYTVWRNISGTYRTFFNDILITAGSKFDQKKLNSLSPFDTDNSKEYKKEFLLGYMSYHYDYSVSSCWNNAKIIMDAQIKRLILSRYVYDKVDYLNVSTSHENVSYKYVMLPIYLGNYIYKSKNYNFYINGRSGKVNGKTPKSVWKILGVVLLGIAVLAGIIAIYLLNS